MLLQIEAGRLRSAGKDKTGGGGLSSGMSESKSYELMLKDRIPPAREGRDLASIHSKRAERKTCCGH